jgi:hypothetical protein
MVLEGFHEVDFLKLDEIKWVVMFVHEIFDLSKLDIAWIRKGLIIRSQNRTLVSIKALVDDVELKLQDAVHFLICSNICCVPRPIIYEYHRQRRPYYICML